MFVDASAMIAIMAREPDWEALATPIEEAKSGSLITSVIAAWEAAAALSRIRSVSVAEAEADVRAFLGLAGIQIVGIAPEELPTALQAYDRYGRHRHPAENRNRSLNLADCFHYASAKTRGLPILHKDIGFTLTDVASAGQHIEPDKQPPH